MALGFSRKHDIEDVLGVMIKIVCVPLLLAGRCYEIENSAPLEILFCLVLFVAKVNIFSICLSGPNPCCE